MNNIITLSLLVLATFTLQAQSPGKFRYQAIARDTSGNVISGDVEIRLTFLEDSPNGFTIYRENHVVSTSDFGAFDLTVGEGDPNIGDFTDIAWADHQYWLKVELGLTPGSGSFLDMGASQLLSVPYALYALKSGNEIPTLSLNSDTLSLSTGGGSVTLPATWRLTGNAGTNPANHFIGTTDNMPLLFKINNTPAGKIGNTDGNTLFGFSAGVSMSSGTGNSGFGGEALFANTIGYDNVAMGSGSLRNNTEGFDNTALGVNALFSNTTGRSNTAIGRFALRLNTTGVDNTAIGVNTMQNNTTGQRNTAAGRDALGANTIGYDNVAVGYSSLGNNTEGYDNTAVGYQALFGNTTGRSNTAIGRRALRLNTTGLDNTVVGVNAMQNNTTGGDNTAVGRDALGQNSTGINNTAIGKLSGGLATTNSSCTFLGYDAGQTVTTSFTNSAAIGNGSRITASNQIRIGNTSVTSIGGSANWTNVSDQRFKKDLQENVPGLDFILQLRPLTYNLDVHGLAAFLEEDSNGQPNAQTLAGRDAKSRIRHTGFLAQEVEQAAQALGFDFSGVDKPEEGEAGLYGLRYAEFTVPLVKAVQEQQEQIEALKQENAALQAEANLLRQLLETELAAMRAELEALKGE